MATKKVSNVTSKKKEIASKKTEVKSTSKKTDNKKTTTSKKVEDKKVTNKETSKPSPKKKTVRMFLDPTVPHVDNAATKEETKVEKSELNEGVIIKKEVIIDNTKKQEVENSEVKEEKIQEVNKDNEQNLQEENKEVKLEEVKTTNETIEEKKDPISSEQLSTTTIDPKAKKHEEMMRALKFFLFSCSAGIIQLGVTTLLGLSPMPTSAVYLIGLVCSVVWNFTFNRKFTFKAANNVPKAMALAFLFYVFFAPASTVLSAYLTNGDVLGLFKLSSHLGILGSNVALSKDIPLGATLVTTFICMVPNLILEFLWQKFVVFRGSIDSNKKVNKDTKVENEVSK